MSNAAAATHEGDMEWVPSLKYGVLAMYTFLASEVMFFGALIGSYIILRHGSLVWPPAGDPELPKGMTGINTLILVASSFTFHWGHKGLLAGNVGKLKLGLLLTVLLGATFLGIQANEWTSLIHEGLLPSKSILGACFFTLTGFHGLHVLGGVVTLLIVYLKSLAGRYSAQNDTGVHMIGLYWHFVDVVWIILYSSLYLL